jgi:hypothetical protein
MNFNTNILIFVLGLFFAIPDIDMRAQIATENSSVQQLLADLDHAKFDVRQHASDALAQFGLKAVPQLVELVLNGSPEQSWRASKILMEIGTRGDEPTMVKIGRVFFLLGARQPELITRAHLIRGSWKLHQLDRVVAKISDLGGQVTRVPVSLFYDQRMAIREPVPRILQDGSNLIIDSSDPATSEENANGSATENPKVEPLSNQQILDRTREILDASADEDIVAIRSESERQEELFPAEQFMAMNNTSFQITIDDKWQGTENDFQSLLDVPSIDLLQLINLKLSKPMMQTLQHCPVRALSIEQCEVDSVDLADYAERHPGTYFNVRGRAILGVRGLVQVRTEANGLVGGCPLSDVVTGGPAEQAGMQVTDVILQVDDAKITKFQDLLFIIAGKQPGDRVAITVARDDQEKVLNVTLGDSASFPMR